MSSVEFLFSFEAIYFTDYQAGIRKTNSKHLPVSDCQHGARPKFLTNSFLNQFIRFKVHTGSSLINTQNLVENEIRQLAENVTEANILSLLATQA